MPANETVIRAPEEADLPALAAVWHDAWQAGHAALDPDAARYRDLPYFQARISSILGCGALAEIDGRIVGFSSWQGDGVAQCFVLPGSMRRGIGSLLLAEAERMLESQGHARIWLHCREGNDGARALYEKHGWRIVRTIDDEIGTHKGPMPTRVWRMEKTL